MGKAREAVLILIVRSEMSVPDGKPCVVGRILSVRRLRLFLLANGHCGTTPRAEVEEEVERVRRLHSDAGGKLRGDPHRTGDVEGDVAAVGGVGVGRSLTDTMGGTEGIENVRRFERCA